MNYHKNIVFALLYLLSSLSIVSMREVSMPVSKSSDKNQSDLSLDPSIDTQISAADKGNDGTEGVMASSGDGNAVSGQGSAQNGLQLPVPTPVTTAVKNPVQAKTAVVKELAEKEKLAEKIKDLLKDGQHEETTDKDEDKFKEYAEKIAEVMDALQKKQTAASPAA